MPIELLKIHNARNLREFTLLPNKKFNIIYGENGVGKTTILESIYLLIRSRTFRSSKYKSFISIDSNDCSIFSKFSSSNSNKSFLNFTIGVKRSKSISSPEVHFNSNNINTLTHINDRIILGLITPESFSLLDAGSSIRRKFLDWGVFHVEHSFLKIWKDYKKVLSNRNALLKKDKNLTTLEQINIWNNQLIDLNNKITNFRKNQYDRLLPVFKKLLGSFSENLEKNLTVEYDSGWLRNKEFASCLLEQIEKDFEAGYTRYGSHRSDLKFLYKKKVAKDVLSRGQKKIIITCLILAQFKLLVDINKSSDLDKQGILLLDDISSELDRNNLILLFKQLRQLDVQTFITTTSKNAFDFVDSNVSVEMFHVEQQK